MTLFTRESLKNFFRKGKFPSQVHFSHLIESTVNKLDDGFSKSEKDGLMVAPQGQSQQLLSFFKQLNDTHPEWQINFKEVDQQMGLNIESVSTDEFGETKTHSWIFLDKKGAIGLNTQKPKHLLDVNGTVGMNTRVGSFLAGQVDGDGKWKPILTNLRGLQAFEVVARIKGPSKRGRYAFTHAIALSTFGRSRSKVKQIRAHYGWFWNRISLKWDSNWDADAKEWMHSLLIRTHTHYGNQDETGKPFPIQFHITRLWDDKMIFPDIIVEEEPKELQKEEAK
jgi:hypothetical protein